MVEGPVGYVPSQSSPHQVCGAEMDAFVDTRVYHVLGLLRDARIRARLLDGVRISATQRKRKVVCAEEEREHPGGGSINPFAPDV